MKIWASRFDHRLAARLVDLCLVYLLFFLLRPLLEMAGYYEPPPETGRWELRFQLDFKLEILFIIFIYQSLMDAFGGTVGKRMFQLRAYNESGEHLGLLRSIGRSAISVLLSIFAIPWIIAVLAVLWSKKRQTWYDQLTEVTVGYSNADYFALVKPSDPSLAPEINPPSAYGPAIGFAICCAIFYSTGFVGVVFGVLLFCGLGIGVSDSLKSYTKAYNQKLIEADGGAQRIFVQPD
jgi:uncharacterized RDD family membrane protein YckC